MDRKCNCCMCSNTIFINIDDIVELDVIKCPTCNFSNYTENILTNILFKYEDTNY